MNKGEFIEALVEKSAVSRKDVASVVNALEEVVTNTLKAGDKVTLTGFGSFETRKRAARKGRNPFTGNELEIPAKTVPAFKASKAFKDALN